MFDFDDFAVVNVSNTLWYEYFDRSYVTIRSKNLMKRTRPDADLITGQPVLLNNPKATNLLLKPLVSQLNDNVLSMFSKNVLENV